MNNTNHTMQDLESFQDFLESPEGKRLFTNKHSGDWFIRTYRKELINAGVLVKFLGRHHIIRPKFESTLVDLIKQKNLLSIDAESGNTNG